MPEHPPARLAALQKQFSDHIRDPEHCAPVEGIEERRLAIYRRLFFNNLSNLFGANFPIARRVLPGREWEAMIRAFMVEHRPTTPLFPEIGREFVRFLSEHPEHYQPQWPWLAELCHWQFQATCVRNDETDLDALDYDPRGDVLSAPVRVNPTLRMAQYQWPVASIRAQRLPQAPEPMVLAIWRGPDHEPARMRLSTVTARLLELLQENAVSSGQMCLKQLADELEHPDPATLARQGAEIIDTLRRKHAVLGTRIG